jgi:hypothetical protein
VPDVHGVLRAVPAGLRGETMSLPYRLAVGFVLLVAALVLIGIILDGGQGLEGPMP